MKNLTQDQWTGIVRLLLQLFGGVATTMGFLTSDQVSQLEASILAIIGPMSIAGGLIWSLIANAKGSIVKSVAAMPETKVEPDGTIKILDRKLADQAIKAANSSVK